jgi:hypothetical protein
MPCLTVSKIAGTLRTQNQSARTYLIAHGPESRAATTNPNHHRRKHRHRLGHPRNGAELAEVTGVAVGLTAAIGGEVVFVDIVDACVPFGLPEPGCGVAPGTAQARAHTMIGRPASTVDVATGARNARQLHVPSTREATILGENSTQWRIGPP